MSDTSRNWIILIEDAGSTNKRIYRVQEAPTLDVAKSAARSKFMTDWNTQGFITQCIPEGDYLVTRLRRTG